MQKLIPALFAAALALAPNPSQAAMTRNRLWQFCESKLSATFNLPSRILGGVDRYIDSIPRNPFPYADESSVGLLHVYSKFRDPIALKELVFRMRAGMLTREESIEFWAVVNRISYGPQEDEQESSAPSKK
jgi:hypothetical protein